MEDFTFFGSADRNKDGKVGSEYPAWTMLPHIEEMEESIHSKKVQIDSGAIPVTEIAHAQDNLKREEERLGEILNSKPKVSDIQKDKIAKEYKSLGGKISKLMFSRDEEARGIASAHEEYRRTSRPCVKVDPEIAAACNVKVNADSMVDRNQASKIWKIAGKFLDEPSNVEYLKVDKRKKR